MGIGHNSRDKAISQNRWLGSLEGWLLSKVIAMVEGEESKRVGGAYRRYSPHVTNVARPPHTLMKPRASLRARAMKFA